MELNSKKLERTSRLVSYAVSTILCVFLVLLSNKIIGDLDTMTETPSVTMYQNQTLMKKLEKKKELRSVELTELQNQFTTIEKALTTAKENYTKEKESFDIWVQTRRTIGLRENDQEVIVRAKSLDELAAIEKEWRLKQTNKQTEIEEKSNQIQSIDRDIFTENERAYRVYGKEYSVYELKVFLWRLLFVAPILGLGIIFFLKYRRHAFAPLFNGFTLFSLYAFFIGLVPYLPSYGGYVRYAVGVILSLTLGYYAIKTIRQYVEKKQEELKISTQVRAQNVQRHIAEKALDNHICPSCGKDFLVKKWEFPLPKTMEAELYRHVTNFCRHCGLELFKQCHGCGHINFAHLPYCSSCGASTAEKEL